MKTIQKTARFKFTLAVLAIASLNLALLSCSKEKLTPQRKLPSAIKGTIFGAENQTLERCAISANYYGFTKDSLTVKSDENGEFCLPTNNAQLIELRIHGVNCKTFFFDLFNSKAFENANLKVRLQPVPIIDTLYELSMVAKFNGSKNLDTVDMKKGKGNIFSAKIENQGDTLFYQYLGAASGLGTVCDYSNDNYVYRNGQFFSYKTSNNSTITIEFHSPQNLAKRKKIKLESNNERFNEYINSLEKIKNLDKESLDIFFNSKGKKDYYQKMTKSVKDVLSEVKSQNARLFLIKQYIYKAYGFGLEADERLVKEYLNSIGVKSTYWEKDAHLLIPILSFVKSESYRENFINGILKYNYSKTAKRRILHEAFVYYFNNENIEKATRYNNILQSRYPDSDYARQAKTKLRNQPL